MEGHAIPPPRPHPLSSFRLNRNTNLLVPYMAPLYTLPQALGAKAVRPALHLLHYHTQKQVTDERQHNTHTLHGSCLCLCIIHILPLLQTRRLLRSRTRLLRSVRNS